MNAPILKFKWILIGSVARDRIHEFIGEKKHYCCSCSKYSTSNVSQISFGQLVYRLGLQDVATKAVFFQSSVWTDQSLLC